MATLTDKAVGTLLILAALIIFLYYTIWVVVLPFVAEDHFIHDYFLPRWYAIVIPVVAGLMLLVIIGLFVGVVLMKESARKKAKQKQT